VVDVAHEDDGDYHVWFKPDPGYELLLNTQNTSRRSRRCWPRSRPTATSRRIRRMPCTRPAVRSPAFAFHRSATTLQSMGRGCWTPTTAGERSTRFTRSRYARRRWVLTPRAMDFLSTSAPSRA